MIDKFWGNNAITEKSDQDNDSIRIVVVCNDWRMNEEKGIWGA